jgi:hypothetical protein
VQVRDVVELPHIPGDRFVVTYSQGGMLILMREDSPGFGSFCYHGGVHVVGHYHGWIGPIGPHGKLYEQEKAVGYIRLLKRRQYRSFVKKAKDIMEAAW